MTHFVHITSLNEHSLVLTCVYSEHFNLVCCHRSQPVSQTIPVDQSAAVPMNQPSASNHRSWIEPLPAWIMEESTVTAEAEVLEEQMLRAGILASLQDAPDDPGAKVEVPKSSVSSLRLVIT